ncbi:unnamed protein product [Symbiodinium sp. CCMP2592]|nr:unnamed protein product [Symbiodinium sp. CCMP2592]
MVTAFAQRHSLPLPTTRRSRKELSSPTEWTDTQEEYLDFLEALIVRFKRLWVPRASTTRPCATAILSDNSGATSAWSSVVLAYEPNNFCARLGLAQLGQYTENNMHAWLSHVEQKAPDLDPALPNVVSSSLQAASVFDTEVTQPPSQSPVEPADVDAEVAPVQPLLQEDACCEFTAAVFDAWDAGPEP